jgi:hypothetical protein
MEWISGALALIFSLSAVGGVAVDILLAQQLRAQLQSAERLEVRVKSIPNYRLALGEIDQVRVAGRGLVVRPGIRIALAELETDPIKLDLNNLGRFNTPLKAAVHVELTEADLNAALNSPEILKSFKGIQGELPSLLGGVGQKEAFDISEPRIRLLQDEIEISALLAIVGKTPKGREIRITIRTGLNVEQGTRLTFRNPRFFLDDVAVPEDLGQAFVGSLNEIIDLKALSDKGITARILRLRIEPQDLDFVGFTQVLRVPGS